MWVLINWWFSGRGYFLFGIVFCDEYMFIGLVIFKFFLVGFWKFFIDKKNLGESSSDL